MDLAEKTGYVGSEDKFGLELFWEYADKRKVMVPPPNSLVLWLPGVVHAEMKINNEQVMSRYDISFQNNKKAGVERYVVGTLRSVGLSITEKVYFTVMRQYGFVPHPYRKQPARHVQDNVVYVKKTQFGRRRDILPDEKPRFIEAVKDAQNRVEALDGSKSTHNTKPAAKLENLGLPTLAPKRKKMKPDTKNRTIDLA